MPGDTALAEPVFCNVTNVLRLPPTRGGHQQNNTIFRRTPLPEDHPNRRLHANRIAEVVRVPDVHTVKLSGKSLTAEDGFLPSRSPPCRQTDRRRTESEHDDARNNCKKDSHVPSGRCCCKCARRSA